MSRDNSFKASIDDDWNEELTGISQQFEKRTANIANQRKLNIRRKIEEHIERREQKKRRHADNDEWDFNP